jgi:hypothetical protein
VTRSFFPLNTDPYVGNKIESLFECLIVITDGQHSLFLKDKDQMHRRKREQFRLVAIDLGHSFPPYSLSSPALKLLNERVDMDLMTNRM